MTKTKKDTDNLKTVSWLASAMFVVGLSVLAGLYWDQTISVQKISYEGYQFVDIEDLKGKSDFSIGLHPDSIDYTTFITSLEEIHYVDRADIHVQPGGVLKIRITEREPLALLADGTQKIYVDKDGVKLRIIPEKPLDVPLLYGFKADPTSDTLQSPEWEVTRNFLTAMIDHPLYNATISEVAWTSDEGVVALTHENGVKLIFGNNEFSSKLRKWKAFYSEIIRDKGIRAMKLVDLRFEGQVVTRES